MFEKKPELKRDLILIGILLLITGIGLILYYSFKKEGEVAVVSYNNVALFNIELESGVFNSATTTYETDEMPVIKGEKLLVKGKTYLNITEGKGVLVYKDNNDSKDYYFIKGNLGYVKIYYNKVTKKMKVVEETSPYNTCSKQGESNDVPIVCLPNFVTISFSDIALDDIM